MPGKVASVTTSLPLELRSGDRIGLVGNSLLDRASETGRWEALLYLANRDLSLVVRNLAWPGDEVDLQPRPENFANVAQYLVRERIGVILAAFGSNESFGGAEKIGEFRRRLEAYLDDLTTSAFDGKNAPRVVLLSPTAHENIAGVSAADRNNETLALYTEAMREVAAARQAGFVDLFAPTKLAMDDPSSDLTINGMHLNDAGDLLLSEVLFRELFGESPPPPSEELRKVVADKNRQWQRRYRPLNTFYYTGGRNKDYGYLDFLPAMRNFDMMVANREARIRALAKGESMTGPIDDSNLPPLDQVVEALGANEWLSPADELASFEIDPRMEVNLFASEEEFPEIACPITMRWDGKGRLWVSCSTTYPHVYPGQEPNDKLVILEDTDQDGRADRSTVFADDLHIPLSFELSPRGVYVSEQPHLTLLEDTDGDLKADRRTHLLSGFGTEDSHHSLHDFIWTPDGDLLFRESIFHHSQVETSYGPVRAQNSAWFRFTPGTQRLISFGSYPNTNPWGVTFDDWGHHVASHPIFASAFHSLNPPYPEQQPKAVGIPAYSGTCGHAFVDAPIWPKEMQGAMIKARYKPTNRIEWHRWVREEDHYAEEYQSDLIFSKNLSFIPVDVGFGPRGDFYICDWYNPVKGHAQYSLRDPRRDRSSGRIWRVVPKGAKLGQSVNYTDASTEKLVEALERPEYVHRYWSKRELSGRKVDEVAGALDAWLAGLDVDAPRCDHHRLEALWMFRRVGVVRPELLSSLLVSTSADARAAATGQLRFWGGAFPDGGLAHLARSARDGDAIVRMEAIIAATYIGTKEALAATAPAYGLPMGNHLTYAAKCAMMSEALRPHIEDPAFLTKHPEIAALPARWAEVERAEKKVIGNNGLSDAFDNQVGIVKVTISCVPERIMYDRASFTVKAGAPVRLTFANPDATQHNFVIVQPGALEEVGMAGNEMAKDPKGLAKGFLPDSGKILHHTRLLNPDTTEILRFLAPETPGVYPYLCTFPGHWIIMKGEMIVE